MVGESVSVFSSSAPVVDYSMILTLASDLWIGLYTVTSPTSMDCVSKYSAVWCSVTDYVKMKTCCV